MICSFLGGLTPTTSSDSPNLAFHPGSNRAGQPTVTRWYWDSKAQRCRPFKYLGQGGNWNNFISEESCQAFCDRAVCLLGQPLRDPSGGVLTCGTTSQCPSSHSCNDGYCCPTAGEFAWISEFSTFRFNLQPSSGERSLLCKRSFSKILVWFCHRALRLF